MPYVLILIGLVLIVTGLKNTYAQLGSALKTDFTGQQSFVTWVVAIGAVGAAGYVKELQTPSRLFMGIILTSLLLSNKGFIAKLQEALKAGPAAIQGAATDAATGTAGAPTTPSGSPSISLKDSLQKPGGGGFWDYIGVPSPF